MNTQTNIQTTALSAGLAVVIFWVLGYSAPEFMAQAPVGAEAAVTGLIAALVGYLVPKETLQK